MVWTLLRIRTARPGRLNGLRRHGRSVHRPRTGAKPAPDRARHFGLVVDDKEGVRAALRQAGVDVAATGSLDFLDPWGNHIQVVDYRDIQFSKAPAVLRAMGTERLSKTDEAREELRRKGVTE